MFDRVTDMPDVIRLGLPADAQVMVRGLVNSLVYDENYDSALAIQKAQRAITNAGYNWNGTRWEPLVKKVKADAVIAKVANDQRLVFGWANVIKTNDGKVLLDRQGDFIDDDWEIEKAAYQYMLSSRKGGVMHVRDDAAVVVESMMFTEEKMAAMGIAKGLLPVGWWLGMQVTDEEVWEDVKSGIFKGFSIHGKGIRKVTDIAEHTHTNRGA